jgi:small neutral amino acid transporter SnatA (MarC family)
MAASINGYVALAMVIVANLVTMLVVAKLMGAGGDAAKKSSGVAEVLLRVIAILLAALAIELIVLGLREYGIIGAAVAAAH